GGAQVLDRHLGHRDEPAGDARVVDQDVERADRLDGGGDRGIVGHVELHEAPAQLLGGGAAARVVTGADPHVVAGLDQAAGGFKAEAAIGPGDQDRRHANQLGARTHEDHASERDTLDVVNELAANLRTWRDRLTPDEPGRRRAPGL